MSECEPLSRPSWVLGVILRKEAPFSFRNSCNCFHRFHLTSDFLNSLSVTTGLPESQVAGLSREELLRFMLAAYFQFQECTVMS